MGIQNTVVESDELLCHLLQNTTNGYENGNLWSRARAKRNGGLNVAEIFLPLLLQPGWRFYDFGDSP